MDMLADTAAESDTAALSAAMADGAAVPAGLDAAAALALAWALKERCLADWSSQPQRAVGAAEALQRLAQDHPGQSEVAALARWTDGLACVTHGRTADALERLDGAAGLWRSLGRPLEAAQTQVLKVAALSMLGQHEQAAECGAQTQQAMVALGDLAGAGKVSLNLGSLQLCRDDYAAAAGHYRAAVGLFARLRDHKHLVMSSIGLSDALAAVGEFSRAERICSRAGRRAARHGLPQLLAMTDESCALLDLARGAFDAALAGLERARRSYEEQQLPQHLVVCEKQLADVYLELRLLPEALSLYDQAVQAMVALDMPDERAWALVQRGRTLALLAQPGAAADALAEAGLLFEARQSAPGAAAVALAQAEQALAGGQAVAARQHAEAAETAFAAAELPEGATRAAALAAMALLQAGDHADARALFERTFQRAQALQLLSLQSRCLGGVGLAALAQGDRATASAALQTAVDQFEAQGRMLPGDELRSAFFADHLAPYQGLLALALLEHADRPDGHSAAQVLHRIDEMRARALAERLLQGKPQGGDAGTEALRTRLHWLHRRVQRQADEGSPSPTLVAAVREAERSLLEHARRQRLAMPVASDGAGPALDVAALQAQLGTEEALVVYGQSGDELLACVVRQGGVRVFRRLASWQQTQEAWQATRFQLDALRYGMAPLQAHLPVLERRAQVRLQQLHALVWAPLAEVLDDARRVLVVPVAGLAGVPFAALHDGSLCLAQRHALAEAPSVRVAALVLQRQPVAARRLLALGDSARLPHAGHEVRAAAGLFAESQVFTGADCTLARLEQHVASADVLHLACHAQFRNDNPMFSALHLHDSQLSAERAESLPLRPGVVVLSACETGLAGQGGGDEQVGLVRAFLVAGAARVLASLWPVDDGVTAQFMGLFYGALCEGQTPSAALCQAQATLRLQHPHPAFWAGFVLHGGW